MKKTEESMLTLQIFSTKGYISGYYRKIGDLSLDTGCSLLQLDRYPYQELLAKVLIRFWLLVQGMKTKFKTKLKLNMNKWNE